VEVEEEVLTLGLVSAPEDTQKEKVGFMEELQLLVGARVCDRLEKEKVWVVLVAENEEKLLSLGPSWS
jgi:hypothetical protein